MSAQARNSRINAAYAELKKLIENNESNSKIIKTANKIVNDDHSQSEAWKCKVVAFIQKDQCKEAMLSIARAPNKREMQYELAYCQYRLNDFSTALATLDGAPDKDSTRGKELRAQILYKLEQHSACYSVYRDLLRSTDDDLDMERSTNMAAVQVQRVLQGECELPAPPSDDTSYEQWYNSACAAVAGGDQAQGRARLDKALQLSTTLLTKDGALEEEICQEQAIIRVQQGYVLQLQGQEKEANAVYSTLLRQPKIEDPALVAILHNNMAAAGARDTNVFETRKKMKATQAAGLEHKLTSLQREQLSLNNCILGYHSQQALQEDTAVVEECQSLLSASKSDTVRQRTALVLAASLAKTGRLEEAVQELRKCSAASSGGDAVLTSMLAAAQLRLMKSDVSGAISELSSLPPNMRYRPGVVGTIVTLLNAKKQHQDVAALYTAAVDWHAKTSSNSSSTSSTTALEHLLRRASEFQLKEGDPRAAAAALEQLRSLNPDDRGCLASLIHAYSQFDAAKAQALSRKLPEITACSGQDADALEASLGPKYLIKVAQKQQEEEEKENNPAAAGKSTGRVKPRKKKRRKTILPKSYVVGVIPDPERWLPRWQRKTVPGGVRRRRDKRKDRDVGKGTQGGVGDATDKYDITKNPGQYASKTPVQQQPEPAGPRRNMPKKKTNRKK